MPTETPYTDPILTFPYLMSSFRLPVSYSLETFWVIIVERAAFDVTSMLVVRYCLAWMSEMFKIHLWRQGVRGPSNLRIFVARELHTNQEAIEG